MPIKVLLIFVPRSSLTSEWLKIRLFKKNLASLLVWAIKEINVEGCEDYWGMKKWKWIYDCNLAISVAFPAF